MATPEEIPDIKKPDLQILLQDLAQARRDVYEERRNTDRVVAAERERARWEIEKQRSEGGEKIKSLERENDALSRAIGRIHGENDRLREENALLRHAAAAVAQASQARASEKQDLKGPSGEAEATKAATMLLGPGQPVVKPALITPGEPPLGKTIPLDPTKR
jgi:septal ring factor EnvC (AmiA/AmiB activator)